MLLIAQGPKTSETWQRAIPPVGTIVLGRDENAWNVPWEQFLSRQHVELTLLIDRLKVRKLAAAANPVFYAGKQQDNFEIRIGETFVIGRTAFMLADPSVPATPTATDEKPDKDKVLVKARAVSSGEIARVAFRDAPHRLDVLNRLPNVISSATDEHDLFAKLGDMLLAGIRRADAVAIVAAAAQSGNPSLNDSERVQVMHWDRRFAAQGNFEPSRKLVAEAVAEQNQTVIHVWGSDGGGGTANRSYTLRGGFDWAFCTPIEGEACPGWGLYVAGRFAGAEASTLVAPMKSNELRDDVKFAELVAKILGSLRQVHMFRERQGVFKRFFSQGVMDLIARKDAPHALAPREADITVLFCDLRGFSKAVEEAGHNLLPVLNRVSAALGVMTRNILANRGAIADFLGDAALGFWGWPLDHPGKAEDACRAALGIRAAFEETNKDPNHLLYGFRVGVGIASGRAVAGGIGTQEQTKITVFGPVVNLSSRLQDMTKLLRVPILIDELTAAGIRQNTSPDVARVRRLAKVLPYGLETPLVVTELIPPAGSEAKLTNEDLTVYEGALDAFLAGDWEKAYQDLHKVPPGDRGKDMLTRFILEKDRTPPHGWTGVIPMGSKN
jgi:adenylate cyclase